MNNIDRVSKIELKINGGINRYLEKCLIFNMNLGINRCDWHVEVQQSLFHE